MTDVKKGTSAERRTSDPTDKYNTILKKLKGDSQNTLILELLISGQTLTQRQMARDFDVYRLSARISDLRKYGVPIETEMERNLHNYGSHARYFLADEATA